MHEADQEKLLIAGAAVGGSLVQFNYIRESLRVGKVILVFITGVVSGIYGGSYIASVIPGCTMELKVLIIATVSVIGRTAFGIILSVVRKKGSQVVETGIDTAVEKLGIHNKGDKEEEDNG